MQGMIGKSKERKTCMLQQAANSSASAHVGPTESKTIACKSKATPGHMLSVFVRVWLHHHRPEASSCCGWPGSGYRATMGSPEWTGDSEICICQLCDVTGRVSFSSSSPGGLSLPICLSDSTTIEQLLPRCTIIALHYLLSIR